MCSINDGLIVTHLFECMEFIFLYILLSISVFHWSLLDEALCKLDVGQMIIWHLDLGIFVIMFGKKWCE